MFQQIKTRNWLYRIWYYLERRSKETLFDCTMCGQCVVRSTNLVCPMQCPKQLRNGPCGGSMNGKCEVYPERRCIWTQIHRRSDWFPGGKPSISKINPAPDWRLYGTSAWLNIWPGKKINWSGRAFSNAPQPMPNRWQSKAQRPTQPADSAPPKG
jgi:hypothetical protein